MNLIENFRKILFKSLYTIFTPKDYHHNKIFWPYFKVIREDHNIKDIIYKGEKIPLSSSYNLMNKDTLIIVATGPSIKELPKKILESEDYDYMGVNGAVTLKNTYFKYYVIFDQGFIINKIDLVKNILAEDCILFTRSECLLNICKIIDINSIKCKIKVLNRVNLKNEIEYFMEKQVPISLEPVNHILKDDFGFSLNIDEYVFDYHTVTYIALQIAYSLNYKYIYIAGLDLTNLNEPRFYENQKNKQPTELGENIEQIKKAFNIASTVLNKEKVQVFNLSKNSLVEAFPKVNYPKDSSTIQEN